ncbi:hypothetical protein K438DRAFT_1992450 [Mycena galopus ATCC 62051]|nr:hypothetical protein K438DRAFT_1992450 [Mycena galopus ATCC 62051]
MASSGDDNMEVDEEETSPRSRKSWIPGPLRFSALASLLSRAPKAPTSGKPPTGGTLPKHRRRTRPFPPRLKVTNRPTRSNLPPSGSNHPSPHQNSGQNASASGSNPSQQQGTPSSGSTPQSDGKRKQTDSPPDTTSEPAASKKAKTSESKSRAPRTEVPEEAQHSTSSSGSNPQGTPSSDSTPRSDGKRKQTDSPPDTTPEPAASKKAKTSGSKNAKQNGSKKAKRNGPKSWAIPRTEVPEEAVGVQKALHLHLRILMGLLSQSAVLTRLSVEDMAPFNARFASATDVDAHMTEVLAAAIEPTTAVAERVAAFLRSVKVTSSQTAIDAARLGEHHLRTMFSALANAGIHSFTPDVFGNPESLYNTAHELVALHSFRVVATDHGYSAIYRTNLAMAKDDHLIQRFYRSFIYGHMKTQASIEERRPGQVGLNVTSNNAYRRRTDLQKTRQQQMLSDCFVNSSVAALVGNKECHSDDEELPDHTGFRVHEKPGRDSAVTALFKAPPQSPTRFLSNQPLLRSAPNVPIDFFSPEFFNDLSMQERASYMNNGIALPTQEHCQTWKDIQEWKGLTKTEFMTKYGATKLALYELPTADELDMLNSMDRED